jgi:hypothetical protein
LGTVTQARRKIRKLLGRFRRKSFAFVYLKEAESALLPKQAGGHHNP